MSNSLSLQLKQNKKTIKYEFDEVDVINYFDPKPVFKEYFYRYERVDADNYTFSCFKLPVLRQTPCGVWVEYWSKHKFILFTSRRKFAWPTKSEALDSMMRRRKKEISLLEKRLEQAKLDMRAANQLLKKGV